MAAQVTYTSGSRSAGLLAHISADQGAESSEHWHSTGSYPLLFIFFPFLLRVGAQFMKFPHCGWGPSSVNTPWKCVQRHSQKRVS